MREGWTKEELSKNVRFIDYRGKTPLKADRGIRLITAKNVKMGYVQREPIEFIDPSIYDTWMTRGFPRFGDVLFTTEAPLGNVAQLDTRETVVIGQRLITMQPNLDKIDQTFLKYALMSPQTQKVIQSRGTGATVLGIKAKLLKQVPITYPSLPEQKRIVAILDEAFEGIGRAAANAEKNLANARELFESYLNAVFTQKGEGWVDRTVGEMAEHSLGKMLDKRKNKGEMKPYLRNLNVRWFEFDLEDVLQMRFESHEHKKYTAIKGDLLICEGGYPGRAAIWESEEPIFFQKAIHRVRFPDPIYNKWLLYFLYVCDAANVLKSHFTGAGIQHFTGKALHQFLVPIAPALEVKKHIESFDVLSEETQRLQAIYERKLHQVAELKQSVLQKAFSGELTAQPDQALKEAVA